MRRILLTIWLACAFCAFASETDLTPQVHGVIRSRWEMLTAGDNESRFQVRNARVSIAGSIAPEISYFAQIDLCDRGKVKFLDAWGKLGLSHGLFLQAGQFRVPFGTDSFRGPANYLFSNRSGIGKIMNNVRGVGAKLSLTLPMGAPRKSLLLEAGAFNPSGIADHEVWCKTTAFAGKAIATVGDFKIGTGAETMKPYDVRINLWNASLTWIHDRWAAEAEYLGKYYVHKAHDPSRGYNAFLSYRFPVKAGVFDYLSFQGRFDGITAYSNGVTDPDTGTLTTNNPGYNRVTLGSTLSYIHKHAHADIRLNYEKYFYRHGSIVPLGGGDKVVAELIIVF